MSGPFLLPAAGIASAAMSQDTLTLLLAVVLIGAGLRYSIYGGSGANYQPTTAAVYFAGGAIILALWLLAPGHL